MSNNYLNTFSWLCSFIYLIFWITFVAHWVYHSFVLCWWFWRIWQLIVRLSCSGLFLLGKLGRLIDICNPSLNWNSPLDWVTGLRWFSTRIEEVLRVNDFIIVMKLRKLKAFEVQPYPGTAGMWSGWTNWSVFYWL